MSVNLIGILSGLFKKKISPKESNGEDRILMVTKGLVLLVEAFMPGAPGHEKESTVVSILNRLIDIPGLDEEQEAFVFGLIIRTAGLAIGLFK